LIPARPAGGFAPLLIMQKWKKEKTFKIGRVISPESSELKLRKEAKVNFVEP